MLWNKKLFSCFRIAFIDGVIISVPASGEVDREFESTKDFKFGMCCFSTKNTALGSKSKVMLAQNHDSVFEWSDMLFQ